MITVADWRRSPSPRTPSPRAPRAASGNLITIPIQLSPAQEASRVRRPTHDRLLPI
jgi:hypothetical protein